MSQKISVTSDYSKFELLPFNRDVERTKHLEASMKEHGWIDAYPIHVIRNGSNGKLRIRAGHHRLEVAQKLHIPVKYVVCNDTATIHQLEKATNRWNMKNYLTSYVREGRHPYITLKRYHERTGIPLNQCLSMLSGDSAGSHNKIDSFKDGTYEVGDTTHAELVADIIQCCSYAGVKWATNSLFINALSKICWSEGFKVNHLKSKIKKFCFLMEKQPTVQDYLLMLETVYNRQSQEKIPLAFLADKAAKERSAVRIS